MFDFHQCIFEEGPDRNEIVLHSEDEYRKRRQKNYLRLKKIVLNEKFNQNLDYFNLPLIAYSYVSEGLKHAIEDANLSGVSSVTPMDRILEISNKAL